MEPLTYTSISQLFISAKQVKVGSFKTVLKKSHLFDFLLCVRLVARFILLFFYIFMSSNLSNCKTEMAVQY